MKFSVSLLQSQYGGQSESEIFCQAVEQVKFAEALGYHGVWMTEQHFSDFGICPDPLTFAAHLAGVTKRIRLCTGVVVLSLHNPVVLAERAAFVDQLSGGRLDLGIGKGHAKQNYAAFAMDIGENETRFYEAHDLIKAAWADTKFSYHGTYFHVDDIRIVPRPIQRPHPPIWVATFGNPAMISFAARRGYPLLHTFTGDSLKKNLDLYRSEYSETTPPTIALGRMLYVHESREQALADMRGPARWYLDNNPGRPPQILSYDLAIDDFINNLGIIGSVEDCIERIRALRDEHHIEHLACIFGPGGVPHEKIMASMRLFAEKVMPELAD